MSDRPEQDIRSTESTETEAAPTNGAEPRPLAPAIRSESVAMNAAEQASGDGTATAAGNAAGASPAAHASHAAPESSSRRRRRSRSSRSAAEHEPIGLAAKVFVSLAILSHWTAAGLLLALPIYLAWDYGGVLAWSRWAAATAVLATVGCALPMLINTTFLKVAITKSARESKEYRAAVGGRVLIIPAICLAVWGGAWLQTIPVGSPLVGWFSRGSASAYEDWIPDSIRSEVLAADSGQFPAEATAIAAGRYPVSICVELTQAAQTAPLIFGIVCLLAAITFRTRKTLVVMLACVAIAGGLMAFLGISDQIRAPNPTSDNAILTPGSHAGAPFGSFACRNNAAGYLNLTLAAAVGLLVYTFLLAKERSVGDEKYEIQPEHWWDRPVFFFQNAILQIDAATVFALVVVIVNIAGILSSQSRGGALGLLAGGLVACLLTGSRSSKAWQPIAILMSIGGAAILLGSVGLIEPVRLRLETLWADDTPQDGRLGHWADALVAAWYYFPAGAGLGTHRYAYLPYQQHSAGAWFVNADNTSVEWLVEGGVWLLPLAIVALVIVAMSLRRITAIRKAPHLTAMIAMGWFLIGSQLVCQFFDFGILLPANYVTAAILVGGIMGASCRRYRADQRSATPVAEPTESERPIAIWVTIGLLSLLLWNGRSVAARNATSEALRREVLRSDGNLGPLTLEIANRLTLSADPDMQLVLASQKLADQVIAGRKTLGQLEPSKTIDPRRDSTLETRRAIYFSDARPAGRPPETALVRGQSLDAILAARQHAIAALMLCPLSDVARFQLVRTDFAADADDQTVAELFNQWAQLRTQYAPALEIALALAAIHPSGETAAGIARRLLEVDSRSLRTIWPYLSLVANEQADVTIADLIPDDVELLVSMLENYSTGPAAMDAATRDTLIGRADGLVRGKLDEAIRLGDGARIAFLAGRLQLAQSNVEAAEPWLKQAVELNPSETDYRFSWVNALEKLDRKSEAIKQLEICLLQQPGNAKFQAKLRSLQGTRSTGSR